MMDFRQAARVLGKELEARGYTWELVSTHKHPRLYIRSNGSEQFCILSTTTSYEAGNLLSMKRQDIERDILPKLPKPVLKKVEEAKPAPAIVVQASTKVYPLKVFVMGRGALAILLPKEAVPDGKPLANAMLTEDKRLYLIFSEKSGKEASTARGDALVAYYFKRREVPFNYAKKVEKGFKTPELCARVQGDTLICDSPLPDELLVGRQVLKAKISLDDGKELREMLNDWLALAEKEGLNPKASVESNRILLKVEVKVEQEL